MDDGDELLASVDEVFSSALGKPSPMSNLPSSCSGSPEEASDRRIQAHKVQFSSLFPTARVFPLPRAKRALAGHKESYFISLGLGVPRTGDGKDG
ncbi:hypothetical protein Taro_047643 [Colocasia esculenta]|uniref:Uncharacterized protein n=1 Tax=Colocasia esculenta TaxID=4460 RepID=A0A843X453_COLES|nr:hypothetical protein [Colocasia esculenta]